MDEKVDKYLSYKAVSLVLSKLKAWIDKVTNAEKITYNNKYSDLLANNIQSAIDELAQRIDTADYVTEERAQEIAQSVLPDGGKPAQVLTKTDDGAEWKDNEIYSTGETRIGTWIDGKPLYRMIIEIDSPGSVSNSNVQIYQYNSNFIVHLFDAYLTEDAGNIHKINWSNIKSDLQLYLYANNNSHKFYMNTTNPSMVGRPVYIIMEYTKTTDEAIIQLPSESKTKQDELTQTENSFDYASASTANDII